jgi:RNA recognition motif-containing protein
VFVGGLDY